MTSKILFFLLIGCALALGFPVDQANEYEAVASPDVEGFTKAIFGLVFKTMIESKDESVRNIFKEISKALTNEEYNKSGTVGSALGKLIQVILDNNQHNIKDVVNTPQFKEAAKNFKAAVDKVKDNQEIEDEIK